MSAGRIIAVTGTSTDVGKTVVTAALVAAVRSHGQRVAVCKPAQTGLQPDEPGDLAQVAALAGPITSVECVRYPEPLAPATAATRAQQPKLERSTVTTAVADLAEHHDVVLVEGAGGVLVRLADDYTLADVAAEVNAPVIVVVDAALGALNHTELTVEALRHRGVEPAGLVIGSWPSEPDLAMTCNRAELARLTDVPLVGVIPAGVGQLPSVEFCARATEWFDATWLATHILKSSSPQLNSRSSAKGALT